MMTTAMIPVHIPASKISPIISQELKVIMVINIIPIRYKYWKNSLVFFLFNITNYFLD